MLNFIFEMRNHLPSQYSGMFANDNGLATQVEAAASTVGELMWRMPLVMVRV